MPWHSSMDKYISAQVKFWVNQKERVGLEEKKSLPFITISREYGCGGYEVAETISQVLNATYNPEPVWAAYDKKLLERVMEDIGISQSLADTLINRARSSITNMIQTTFSKFPSQVSIYKKLAEFITMLALNGHVIIVGRAGRYLTRELEGGFHVRLVASLDWRIDRVASIRNLSQKESKKLVQSKAKERHHFIKEYVKFDISDPHNYHIVINENLHTPDESAKLIIEGMKIKGLLDKKI